MRTAAHALPKSSELEEQLDFQMSAARFARAH
jgi:hypothetical protein